MSPRAEAPRTLVAGLVAGVVADRVLADPPRWHPVAGFGRLASAVERGTHRDSRLVGAVDAAALVAVVTAVAAAADHRVGQRPVARVALVAACTWAASGGTSLGHQATRLGAELEACDVDAARRRLPALCAREPAGLDDKALVRATVESVAENTADAAVAPLVFGALLGPAGTVAHRAVNTLDAMFGYRSARYLRFGWAAARLDDAVNWLPARLTAALAVALAPLVGGSPRVAAAVWRRDAAAHPSPNAGPVEAAFAGALAIRLGGDVNRYGDVDEPRPSLGDGPTPEIADIARTVRLSRAVTGAALAVCLAVLAVPRRGVAERRA